MTFTTPPEAAASRDEVVLELPGRLGGDYIVERALGQSPLGSAFLARSPVSGRPVVIKVLADQLAADEVQRGRFLRAAELGMRLAHPNVTRVFKAGVEEGPYAVMEHISGETLANRLERGERLSADEALTLATHLAAGLAHAHASGVVHGGLDAASIVLGDDGVARICDFGFARLSDGCNPGPADDVHGFGVTLREASADGLLPGLTAIIDAALAHPSVRPSAFDVFHQTVTLTSPPGVWLAGSVSSIAAGHPPVDGDG
jgi:serine/threonine protein kinase